VGQGLVSQDLQAELSRENEELKAALDQKNERIAELEGAIVKMMDVEFRVYSGDGEPYPCCAICDASHDKMYPILHICNPCAHYLRGTRDLPKGLSEFTEEERMAIEACVEVMVTNRNRSWYKERQVRMQNIFKGKLSKIAKEKELGRDENPRISHKED